MRPLFYLMDDKISYERENILKLYESNKITWNNIVFGISNKKKILEKDCKITINEQILKDLNENGSVVDYLDTTN